MENEYRTARLNRVALSKYQINKKLKKTGKNVIYYVFPNAENVVFELLY